MLRLAWLERNVHARCGHLLDDVLDPAAEGDPERRIPPRYFTPEVPKVCRACAAREDVIAADHEKYPKRPHPGALIWPVYDRGKDR